ncbi:MAG TPA: hypothetical protein VFV34_10010 [Blastocatellia bacterium]|nr:hypothetical protein [Blastocatellia bacterium]
MELFTKLFGSWLVLVYHCFDRMVISGYLMGLLRPGQVVYWLRGVEHTAGVTKEILASRTLRYVRWVESFARNHRIPVEWAERGVRKEDYVLPYLKRAQRRKQYGVYFIFQAMEQGWTFRPSKKPHSWMKERPMTIEEMKASPLICRHYTRFRFYYFYLRDEVLGAMIMRVGTFIPFEVSFYLNGHNYIENQLRERGVKFKKDDNAFLWVEDVTALQQAADTLNGEVIRKRLDYWTFVLGPKFTKADRQNAMLHRSYYVHQVEYSRNFVFKRNHPIRKLFERSCELGLWRLSGDRIIELFGRQSRERLTGKLHTVLDRVEHGKHVFRAYWKNAFVKQYEKYSTFLRNEVTSNNLNDFGLKKGLAHLGAAREKLMGVLDRFAAQQAENLNVHEEFGLLTRIALPVRNGTTRIAGIRVQDRRMIRLMEVMLHAGTGVGGWTAKHIHEAVVGQFGLRRDKYGLNSLRYDLRKLKGHGLLERVEDHYRYRLTDKGRRVAMLMLMFHQRLCGPLAGSQFANRPDANHRPKMSKLEEAYYKADEAIDMIVQILKAA